MASEPVPAIHELAERWRGERAERQRRRHLERADFDALRDAGLLRMIVPQAAGGTWRDLPSSIRSLCDTYRRLAAADPSVALVSAMHPAVLSFWVASPDGQQPEWEEQRRAVFASAAGGEQWGTVTSEPGSGGDLTKTRAVAVPTGDGSRLPGSTHAVTGDKHFASGMGITDWMMTTAVPDGSTEPTIFALEVRDRPWDGSAGLRLVGEWDGMGMAATQSHAMRLEGAPGVRLAWDGPLDPIVRAAAPVNAGLFTAVVLGVLDEAVALARQQVGGRAEQLRAFERVEWSRAEMDHWLARQAYHGALRAIEADRPGAGLYAALRAKESVADLAEQVLLRLTRVLGGGTFSQRSPFAHWFEDVRALGFLRPPWGLAFDTLFATSLDGVVADAADRWGPAPSGPPVQGSR
jgi:alkylation response protein AidB-like acyl-CoA dehydrogenase